MEPPPPRAYPPGGVVVTIDLIGEDLLQNIIARLPAVSFASAACVSRSWNLVCDRILCRPKLSSAVSLNSSLQVAVEEVLNKALSEPIRPHFAIASIGPSFDLHQAHQLIIAKLGSKVPVITNISSGIIGRDALSDEFKEIQWEITGEDDDDQDFLPHPYENRAIMLIVGFMPGLKVEAIPLLKKIEEPQVLMIDKFVMDIREYSASISGHRSPAAIMMFSDCHETGMKFVMENMDYAMSPDTVIVGANDCHFLHSSNDSKNTATEEHSFAAVALVFGKDKHKLPGTRETQFEAMLSCGLSPIGPTYKAASVREKPGDSITWLTARREGVRENIDGETILSHVYDELGNRIHFPTFYIGVTKRRKYSIGQDKVRWMTSLAFHEVLGDNQEYLFVSDVGIKTGDTFRFYHSNSTIATSSCATISDQLRRLKTSNTEVFGGLIFTCCGRGVSFFDKINVDSAPFLENFPGVTVGGMYCGGEIGRGDLTPYANGSEEEKSVRCCLHSFSAVYLVMSYVPSIAI